MLLGCRIAHPHSRGRSPFDRTNRKITAWPNHANRNFSLERDYETTRDGDMAQRALDPVIT